MPMYESSALLRIVLSMGNTITHVVFSRKITTKLHRFANATKALGCSCCPRKKRMRYFTGDCNEFEHIDDDIYAVDVPKGYFAVYVGSKRVRFIIPTTYLNHPLFQALLKEAEEEYGFHYHMGLTIPCERVAFKYVTSVLGNKDSIVANMDLDEIMKLI